MPAISRPLRVGLLGSSPPWRDDGRVEVVDASGSSSALQAVGRLRDVDVVVGDRETTATGLLRALGVPVVVGAAPTLAALCRTAGRPGAGLAAGPPVSVIATVLNEAATVAAMVREVAGHLGDADELVVADGGSSDGTAEVLAGLAGGESRLRVVEAPGTNISGGRNVAIEAAVHEVIVCADAGCSPLPGWLDAIRVAFADGEVALVSGIPGVEAGSLLEAAQAAACYPDPAEGRRRDLWTRSYTKVFGTSFAPEVPFARWLAFTKAAWRDAGGFPEGLGWVEDGTFGLAVARSHPVGLLTDGGVTWVQRPSLRATFRMYRNYGVGAAQSRQLTFVARDATRGGAYLVAAAALAGGGRRARAATAAGAALYLSQPLRRLARRGRLAAAPIVPLALVTKDIGKLVGEATAIGRHR